MQSATRILVLGTHNQKKRAELVELLQPQGLEIRTLDSYPAALEVVENGNSFAENARLKACEQAKHLNAWVLGEDSGLVVPALGGRPGIYSARFSGPGATDSSNNALLLTELASTPLETRSAYYVCSMALSDPRGEIRAVSEGACHGRIRYEVAGEGGFGYDPLFEIAEYHRTFAELGTTVKSVLSHRARAMGLLIPQITALLAADVWR